MRQRTLVLAGEPSGELRPVLLSSGRAAEARRGPTVVVVGAGLAGLVGANLLAKDGLQVTVLEARPHVRAVLEIEHGVTPLTAGLLPPQFRGSSRGLLRQLGIELGESRPLIARGAAIRDGATHRLPVGPLSLAQTSLLSRRAKLEIARWAARLPLGGSGALASISARYWLRSTLMDEDARQLASALTRVASGTADLHLLSADAARAQLRGALSRDLRVLDTPWEAILNRLERRALARGCRIEAGVRVTTLERTSRRWRIETDAGELVADSVLVAPGDPRTAAQILKPVVHVDWTLGPPAKGAVLEIGLARAPTPTRLLALSVDQPFGWSLRSASRVHGPPFTATVVALGRDAPEIERGTLEAFADVAQTGWRDDALLTRHVHETTLARAIPTGEGHGLSGRPAVTFPREPGIVVAGDWVGDEGLLGDAAVASAARAAESLIERAHPGKRHLDCRVLYSRYVGP